MTYNPRSRLRLISIVLVLLALVFIVKLFSLQLLNGAHYRSAADRQIRPMAVPFDRGNIYFTEASGRLVSAATLKSGFVASINPPLITDPDSFYTKLQSVLPTLDRADFLAKANRRTDPYEEIAQRLSDEESFQLRGLKLPGLQLSLLRWRYYPGEQLAAHVIGFMGYRGEEYTGLYGLERSYNQVLEREERPVSSLGQFLAEIFSGDQVPVNSPSALPLIVKSSGDVVTTIEPVVQSELERLLDEATKTYLPTQAGGIVLDPETGVILAMAARPTFKPGGRQTDIALLSNPLVEEVYEMGSIIKPLTLAAALDALVITPTTTYFDAGQVTIGPAVLKNFDGQGRGTVSMQEVLNQSLNTGAVFAMRQLGPERFRTYFESYGLGEKTGVDLPGEVGGLIKNLSSGREVESATAAFGQGIALTPLATARALATLGNGGRLVKPRLVTRIEYTDGTKQEIPPTVSRQVLSASTSRTITDMLVKTVDTALANGTAKLPHYRVAAKTGTAQIPGPAGGYLSDLYLHSFFGYFPADHPRFLTFLYLVKPQGARYASETLTRPFMNLTKFLLNYYRVPPDR